MKLLLIAAHGWNSQWASCYGNEWLQMPQLDRIAAQSLIMDHHFCTQPTANGFQETFVQPLFSACELSGLPTVQHVYRPSDALSLWAWARQTAKRLHQEPQWCVLLETTQLLPPWAIAAKAFEHHTRLSEEHTPENPLDPWPEPPSGECYLDDRAWERLRLSFACAVEQWDRDMTLVKQSFFPKDDPAAVVIITGAFGYPLGEHDCIGPHATCLFGEEYHVPLLIQTPTTKTLPGRYAGITTPADLVQLLMTNPLKMDLDVLPTRTTVQIERPSLVGKPLTTIRRRDCTYVIPQERPASEGLLFIQPDDRWERLNLAHSQPGIVEDLTRNQHD